MVNNTIVRDGFDKNARVVVSTCDVLDVADKLPNCSVDLITKIILFDSYMGVGSTLIAAIMHNRRAWGCDKEQLYVDIAVQRIKDYFDGCLRYRPIGKPIYQPSGNEKISKVPEEWLGKSGRITNT